MEFGFFTVYLRDMKRYVRFRTQLLSSLIMPAVWLAFFGVSMASNLDRLSDASAIPGVLNISYLTFMGAGVIAMTTLFTSIYGGFVLLFDKNWGLMREIMASPLPRRDIVIGIAGSGVTKSWIQTTVVILFGLLLGVHFFTGQSPLRTVVSFGGIFLFVALFSAGFVFLSAALALSMDSPEGFQGITTLLTMPLFFVSNALYPITGLPQILQDIAVVNPLSHLVRGIRYFAIGDDFTAVGMHIVTTPGEVLISLGVLFIFVVIMFAFALRQVNRTVVT